MSINQADSGFGTGLSGSGAGGGLLYPDSAARPFTSNSARNNWANNNKADLIKDTTVVNVGGTQWYLWTGESNPDTVQTSLWMDAAEIVPGEKGDAGDSAYQIWINAGNTGTEQDFLNSLDGKSAYQSWIDAGNTGTEQDFIDSLKGEKGDDGLSTTSADIDGNGDLIITLSDGSTLNAGLISGFDPKLGFELNAGARKIGLNNDGALTVRDSGGTEHNAIDNGVDIIRVGSPSLELELRTNQERITVQNSQGDTELAYITDIPDPTTQTNPSRLAYWVREQTYALTANDISKEIILSVQPQVSVGGTREATITFPSQAAFTDHYYIPGVSPLADEATKPNIETFRFSLWAYYFQSSPVKITMLSDGNWLPFVSSESLSEEGGVYLYRESEQDANELHTFAFMRPINFNPAVGLQGWVLQNVHPYSWLPLTSQPPSSPPISTLGSFMIDDDESSHLRTGAGIQSTFDPATGDHTLTVDPTNIDLSDYAKLETDVAFSKVTVKNPTDPLFESVVNVTNGGNTEVNLVGTSNLRKVDKTTGVATDVMNINGTSGAVDLRTDATYQGAINSDASLVNRQYVDSMAYYKGQGLGIPASTTISTNTVEQTTPVAFFENSLSHDSETIITIDESLVAAETIIKVSALAQYTSKTFLLYHGATDNGEKTVRRGETWRIRLDASGTNNWVYERVDDGTRVTRGLGGRLTPVEHPHVGVFQYAENMPYHLLVETPTSSRLVHEFPREKTFRFTPISTGREHDNNVVINEANQGVATNDLELGQYSDLPLYVIEPNVVVNRDQRAWINFPANMTLDVSAGFYAFGTVSGWCGNNTTEGNVAVYVGTSENFRSYTQNVGFVLGNSGVFLLDGQNLRTAQNSAALQFNVEPGVTHMIRYAFYVDASGLMTYYILDLNTGQLSTGTQQCNLSSIGSNPKMYVSYDRFSNNTAAIAIAETHLVVNSVGGSEGRWSWRN